MAQYLLLVYEDEPMTSALPSEEEAALVGRFQDFMRRNGASVERGQRLHPTSTATSVRRDAEGGVRISDGAFVESKEVVAGYFLIEAENLAEALRLAEEVPVPNGGIEVRPIRSVPGA
ncbi:YciI family protein [Streptomyces sp. NPDC017546]|uniref:YciI family protein n=1 Tax=unclassified Streptomyces TaxID=2593676 RepID=UPI002362352C|nr:YciI family protein [Streptomyces sp. MMBL 11-1]